LANCSSITILEKLYIKDLLDYQFGFGFGSKVLKSLGSVERGKNGKIRRLYTETERLIATLVPSTGLFSLSIAGGELLRQTFSKPRHRVIVPSSVSKYIRKGRNVFAKYVLEVDMLLRSGDEVIVVDENDSLLAVGKLLLSPREARFFKRGVAVKVRKGLDRSSFK